MEWMVLSATPEDMSGAKVSYRIELDSCLVLLEL